MRLVTRQATQTHKWLQAPHKRPAAKCETARKLRTLMRAKPYPHTSTRLQHARAHTHTDAGTVSGFFNTSGTMRDQRNVSCTSPAAGERIAVARVRARMALASPARPSVVIAPQLALTAVRRGEIARPANQRRTSRERAPGELSAKQCATMRPGSCPEALHMQKHATGRAGLRPRMRGKRPHVGPDAHALHARA